MRKRSISVWKLAEASISEGLGGILPTAMMDRGSSSTPKTLQASMLANRSLRPFLVWMRQRRATLGLRMSQSMRSVGLPSMAKAMAMLLAVRLLPSAGLGLVTPKTRHSDSPWEATLYIKLVLSWI